MPKDTAPAVEISYYNNTIFPELLTDTVEVGEIIYTKVVFSENVPIIIADDKSARPSISYSIGLKYSTGLKKIKYRMKPQGVSINEMQSGDMRSYKNTKNIFVCTYVVRVEDASRGFGTSVDGETVGGTLDIIFAESQLDVPLEWKEKYENAEDWAVMRPFEALS